MLLENSRSTLGRELAELMCADSDSQQSAFPMSSSSSSASTVESATAIDRELERLLRVLLPFEALALCRMRELQLDIKVRSGGGGEAPEHSVEAGVFGAYAQLFASLCGNAGDDANDISDSSNAEPTENSDRLHSLCAMLHSIYRLAEAMTAEVFAIVMPPQVLDLLPTALRQTYSLAITAFQYDKMLMHPGGDFNKALASLSQLSSNNNKQSNSNSSSSSSSGLNSRSEGTGPGDELDSALALSPADVDVLEAVHAATALGSANAQTHDQMRQTARPGESEMFPVDDSFPSLRTPCLLSVWIALLAHPCMRQCIARTDHAAAKGSTSKATKSAMSSKALHKANAFHDLQFLQLPGFSACYGSVLYSQIDNLLRQVATGVVGSDGVRSSFMEALHRQASRGNGTVGNTQSARVLRELELVLVDYTSQLALEGGDDAASSAHALPPQSSTSWTLLSAQAMNCALGFVALALSRSFPGETRALCQGDNTGAFLSYSVLGECFGFRFADSYADVLDQPELYVFQIAVLLAVQEEYRAMSSSRPTPAGGVGTDNSKDESQGSCETVFTPMVDATPTTPAQALYRQFTPSVLQYAKHVLPRAQLFARLSKETASSDGSVDEEVDHETASAPSSSEFAMHMPQGASGTSWTLGRLLYHGDAGDGDGDGDGNGNDGEDFFRESTSPRNDERNGDAKGPATAHSTRANAGVDYGPAIPPRVLLNRVSMAHVDALLSLQAAVSSLLLVGRREGGRPSDLQSDEREAGVQQAQQQLNRLEDVSRQIVNIVLQLLPLRTFPHRARIRMGQGLACALIEQMHSFQPEAGPTRTADGCVKAAATLLDRFRAAPLVISVMAILRTAPKSKAAFKVATIALSRFFRYAAVLHPQLALYVLAQLTLCWLEVFHDEECAYFIESHLKSMTKGGLLTHVMVLHADLALDCLVLPLLLAEVDFANSAAAEQSDPPSRYVLNAILRLVDAGEAEPSAEEEEGASSNHCRQASTLLLAGAGSTDNITPTFMKRFGDLLLAKIFTTNLGFSSNSASYKTTAGIAAATESDSPDFFSNAFDPAAQVVASMGDGVGGGLFSAAASRRRRDLVAVLRKLVQQEGNPTGMKLPDATGMLFADSPVLVFHLLLSPYVQNLKLSSLVDGEFLKLLSHCATLLNVRLSDPEPVSGDKRSRANSKASAEPSSKTIVEVIYCRILVGLVWCLGAFDSREKLKALKGLKLMCCFFQQQSWQPGTETDFGSSLAAQEGDRERQLELALRESVADELSSHFLMLNARLPQCGWLRQTQRQQEQSMRVVLEIICILKVGDLCKYLPKCMILVDTALASRNYSVRLIAVRISRELCRRLPMPLLSANLSSLIVGLFPLLEGQVSERELDIEKMREDLALVGSLRQDRNMPIFTTPLLETPLLLGSEQSSPMDVTYGYEADNYASAVSSVRSFPISVALRLLSQAAFSSKHSSRFVDEARLLSVDIMCELFVKRAADLKNAIRSVAYIPNVPELKQVLLLHQEEFKGLSIKQALRLLCNMLKHVNCEVRVLALRRLASILRSADSKDQLHEAVIAVSQGGSGVRAGQTVTSELLRELLSLLSHESDPKVSATCAQCLGELGAIDPSRVRVLLPRYQGGGEKVDDASGSAIKRKVISAESIVPWDFSVADFGVYLLENHLVPMLKSDSNNSDRAGFAIQKILAHLAKVAQPGWVEGTNCAPPEQTRRHLSSRGIFDATEPFWHTCYDMQPVVSAAAYPSRLTFSGITFTRWIGLWLRYLISLSGGPLSEIFSACRGVVRNSGELCQFLLPHVVTDIIGSTDGASAVKTTATTANESAFQNIVGEVTNILKDQVGEKADGTTNRKNVENSHTSVQAIFMLLDTLRAWAVTISRHKKNLHENQKKAAAHSFYPLATLTSAFGRLFAAIPRDLLAEAALSIRAYARALRYIEITAREAHSKHNFKSASGSSVMEVIDLTSDPASLASGNETNSLFLFKRHNDKANGALPVLTATTLEQVLSIFAKLEDADALQGTLALQQVYGHKASPWNRILELEQTDNWLGALIEYGLISSSPQYQLYAKGNSAGAKPREGAASALVSIDDAGEEMEQDGDNGGDEDEDSDVGRSAAQRGKGRHKRLRDAQPSKLAEGARDRGAVEVLGDSAVAAEVHNSLSLAETAALEKGRLRCMIELGHLEAVMDQTRGALQRLPELEASLLPLGVEAGWRLMRWDDLNTFLDRSSSCLGADASSAAGTAHDLRGLADMQGMSVGLGARGDKKTIASFAQPEDEKDAFQVGLGRLFVAMHGRNKGAFMAQMDEARRQTIASLSAACMESYGRAYPLLSRLHVLHELECGYELLQLRGKTTAETCRLREERLDSFRWKERRVLASNSATEHSLLQAVRRAVLAIAGMDALVAQNWWETSQSLRLSGKFDAAQIAIKNAEACGLGEEQVLLQECKILSDSGHANKALKLLEPMEIDAVAISEGVKSKRLVAVMSETKQQHLAAKIHLATQLMVQSQQQFGQAIIDRYDAVINLYPKWESAHFELGKYFEYLFHEAQDKEGKEGSLGGGGSSSAKNQGGISASSMVHVRSAIEKYGECLRLGTKYIVEVLPRMLTLWMAFTSLPDSGSSKNKGGSLKEAKILVNNSMQRFTRDIPASTWYECMPQLVSRIGHSNKETLVVLQQMLLKVMTSFPNQGVWHIAGLIYSLNPDRKKIGTNILNKAKEAIKATRSDDAQMLVDSQKLFRTLIDLASLQTKERVVLCKIGENVNLGRFLVPTQGVLHKCCTLGSLSADTNSSTATTASNSSSKSAGAGSLARAGRNNYNSTSTLDLKYIANFDSSVQVFSSKAKPKAITLQTQCGTSVKFLCKQEKDGDLRKDARMMEFNLAVNRLLSDDPEGRKRSLRLRTYAVVCLNEECGILEWVEHTNCIRHLILEAHMFYTTEYPLLSYRDVYDAFLLMQKEHADDIEGMLAEYDKVIKQRSKPCLHRWFIERFPDPTEWLEARTLFTRSAAIWSGVGFVIGLGDRHTENLLLDQSSGECVHVDFDCLFDKGLSLAKPEIIPFRLTPEMVDAMGPTGVEGAFRKTLEVAMQVLRQNRDTLLSVLEPFLRDPTVSWARSGRQQRLDAGSGGVLGTASERGGAGGLGVQDSENEAATEMLQKIRERLNGVYNLRHPFRDRFVRHYKLKVTAEGLQHPLPARGIGIGADEALLPLSVTGQVQRLIDEATCDENLMQLFVGWQPWL